MGLISINYKSNRRSPGQSCKRNELLPHNTVGAAAYRRSRKPAALLVGGADELFYPDRFAPLFELVRPDLHIAIVPGIGHIGMSVAPAGIAAVQKSFLDLAAPATG